MPRIAKLRNKGGFWASDARGKTRYFGKVDEVPYVEALRRFREFLALPALELVDSGATRITVDALADLFLAWVGIHRSERSREERTRHVDRFRKMFGPMVAAEVRGEHLERLIARLAKQGYAPDYIAKHVTSVTAMFNRGSRQAWLPVSFRPFLNVEPVRRPPRVMGETEIPTNEEVRKLLARAEVYRDGNMKDLLPLYFHTGARTAELIAARAKHFFPATRQIVLTRHKRSTTLRDAVPRAIYLNPAALEIMRRRTAGLDPEAFVFLRPDGRPYTSMDVANRFTKIRTKAKVRGEVSTYSFRHLWISDMLVAGVDTLLIARMAGTSVKMIESTYGHFRTSTYEEAQGRLDASRAGRGPG